MSPHGTTSRYTNSRCRCDDCRTAWSTYHRERRRKYRATHPPKPHPRKVPQVEHPVIVARIRAGEKLDTVGADYGVTREAIRQIVAATDPTVTAGRAAALAEIKRLRAENEDLRTLVESLTRLVGGELIVLQPSGVAS